MKVFIEEQRFTQLWLHILLLVSFMLPIVLVSKKWLDSDKSDKGASFAFYLILGSFIFIYALIFSFKLKTRIDENGVEYRFVPFHFSNRIIPWNEITKAYIRKYDAISEYGGWGIKGGKFWKKDIGVAYNVKGDLGIQLELKNGKKYLYAHKNSKMLKVFLAPIKIK